MTRSEGAPQTAARPHARVTSSDERLVDDCLKGDEEAWSALIDKYKNLIFSIPIKYGIPREDAADVFQAVCLELFSELSSLRKSGSVRSWIITVATHKSFHWKKRQRRRSDREVADDVPQELSEPAAAPPQMIVEAEREQMVREAVARLQPRCAEMVRLLFFEQPPLPYNEVARRFGLAVGSVGFIRGRCLKRLQKLLEEAGF